MSTTIYNNPTQKHSHAHRHTQTTPSTIQPFVEGVRLSLEQVCYLLFLPLRRGGAPLFSPVFCSRTTVRTTNVPKLGAK
jgi:hypothetical protein